MHNIHTHHDFYQTDMNNIFLTAFIYEKGSYIHISNFATLMSHNLFLISYYIKIFTHISLMIGKSSHKISML